MGVILDELVKQINPQDIQIVAGKKGLSNLVEWAHMVDNAEIASFLGGGEIAFTTGIGIREDMSLLDLVKSVYEKNASGIFINVGPFIEEIGQEIIEFGNEHDFPIFEIPWRVHMADIMRMVCGTITRSEQRAMELTAAFKNAIFSPKMEELYIPVLMQKGYYTEWTYVVAVIDICDCTPSSDEKSICQYKNLSTERAAILQKKIERRVLGLKYDAVIYPDQDKLLIIFSDTTEKEAAEMLSDISSQIQSFLKNQEVVFSAVGKEVHQIREVGQSYIIAHRMAEFMKLEGMENEVRSYKQMGLMKMLLNLKSLDCLEEYYSETIGPLEEYDETSGGNLIETLTCYMKHNGSVQDAAEELYVHRNTVNYKLKKIESLLDVNLTDFQVRTNLMEGLLVRKMRKLK